MKKLLAAGAAILIALGGDVAVGQSISVPQVQSIGPSDLFQDIQGGQPRAQSYYATVPLMANLGATYPGNNPTNDIIGGDFGSNLYQDGASVTNISTTVAYVADQWFAFSGTSTALTGAQETSAADIPTGYSASERISRTGAGILQSCVGTIIAANNVQRYQGQTAEFDFHALANASFSPASGAVSVILVQGTSTNESAVNFGHTINTALTGSNWTGATTETATMNLSNGWVRYTSAFPVATTTTEMGVAICFTPVGAGSSSDWFEFTGAMLTPNSALTTLAGASGAFIGTNDTRAKSFTRRPAALEAMLQYQFYWRQNEAASAAAGAAGVFGWCQGTSTSTVANCYMQFPVPMYKVPIIVYTAGTIAATVGTAAAAEAVSALAIASNGATLFGANLTATSSSVSSGAFGFLESGNSTGGGKITFNARF